MLVSPAESEGNVGVLIAAFAVTASFQRRLLTSVLPTPTVLHRVVQILITRHTKHTAFQFLGKRNNIKFVKLRFLP
jgi:hypothetical protein